MIGSPSHPSHEPLPYLSPDASRSKPKQAWGSPFRSAPPDTNLYVSKPRRSGGAIQWNWIIAIYGMALCSTLIARWCVNLEDGVDALERRSYIVLAQRDHMQDDLNKLDGYIFEEQAKMKQLKNTRKALEHEIQVIAEYHEETGRNQFLQQERGGDNDDTLVNPSTGTIRTKTKHTKTIQKWLTSRRDNLVRRIHHLQTYLQRMSYSAVVRKFGPGPTYHVQWTIDMRLASGKRSLESLTIETVPLQDMPAAIHMFLDTVASEQIWSNAMFVHHKDDLDHVLPAAPVDYETHHVRRTMLGSLGWVDLGFPEYTSKYPHYKYTVGFAGKGPTFYINTVDNSEDHGPGGQDHHLLPEDADPCFGRVVEGQRVVDDLVKYGSIQTKMAQNADHPWADEDHRSTRIVSAKIIKARKDYVEQ